MRLLQLATGPDELLDLHPNVSVVTGLGEDARRALVEAVVGLARAEAAPGGGLLEAHGVLFDLDAALLAVLDLPAGGIDPIVRPGQLPGQAIAVDARELRDREEAFAALLARIAEHVEQQAAARAAVEEATRAVEQARRERDDAERGAAQRLEEVDRRTQELDRLVERQRQLQDELASARAALALAPGADDEPSSGPAPPDESRATSARAPLADPIERVEARARELDHLLGLLVPADHLVVEEALAVLEGRDGAELVPSPEAAALADELDLVDAELRDARGEEVAPGELAAARSRLDEARHALVEAEHAVRIPKVDPASAQRLEDLHEHVLIAMERADGRLAGARAAKRVTELRAEEQALLDQLGFTSYSAYVMGHSLVRVDPGKEAALRVARDELAAAEGAWSQREAAAAAALARAAVLDRRRSLLEQAHALLGEAPEGPPQEALRALRVPPVPVHAAAEHLHAALRDAGVDLADEELDHEELVLIAGAWLDEIGQLDERRAAITTERARLAEERRALEAQQEAGDRPFLMLVADPVPDPEPAAGADGASGALAEAVAALEEQLAEASRRVTAAADALRAEPGTERDLEVLDAAVDAAQARCAAAVARMEEEDAVVVALDAEGRAAALEVERLQDLASAPMPGERTPAEELEWYLLARLAGQRAVSVAGSVPLLLDDALRGLSEREVAHLLDRLERMAEAVQVIVVSDDPIVAGWAVEAGSARAAVVWPGSA